MLIQPKETTLMFTDQSFQRIQTTEDFTTKAPDKDNRKRPAQREDGPVLGTPVLQLFLKPAKDKVFTFKLINVAKLVTQNAKMYEKSRGADKR